MPPSTDNLPRPSRPFVAPATALVVWAVVGIHILLTLVYLSGPNLLKIALGKLPDRYMGRLFSQNWHLFSPNPGISSRKLAIRCQAEGSDWSEWIDPLEPMLTEYYQNRFSGMGKLLYVYRGMPEALSRDAIEHIGKCLEKVREAVAPLEADSPDLAPEVERILREESLSGENQALCGIAAVMPELVRLPSFRTAGRYAHDVCVSYVGEDAVVSRFEFKTLEFYPLRYSKRTERETTGRRWEKVVEIVYPTVDGEDDPE